MKRKTKITLDKLNVHLRKTAKKYEYNLNIIQTNNESTATKALQRLRNKIFSCIIFPGPWQRSGYVLKDTLELLNIPFITVPVLKEAALKNT